jgi:hypothetical protein
LAESSSDLLDEPEVEVSLEEEVSIMKTRSLAMLGVVALFAFALPVLADDVVYSGIDIWRTPANGTTYFSFAKEPLPAGFFCAKSEPFTGRVILKGVPVVTADGSLGSTDTIVQRLDDAAFDEKGVATTRVRLRALQLESVKPIKTACGQFKVRIHLDGDQPITQMRILKENENGGHFLVPIALRVKVSLVPVRGKARQGMELIRVFRLRPNPQAVWSHTRPDKSPQRDGFVLVDTDGDGRTDTFLPGTSNFAPGVSSLNKQDEPTCHWEDNAMHCPEI